MANSQNLGRIIIIALPVSINIAAPRKQNDVTLLSLHLPASISYHILPTSSLSVPYPRPGNFSLEPTLPTILNLTRSTPPHEGANDRPQANAPPAPPGVDADVLARINAFMNHKGSKPTLTCVTPIRRDGNANGRKPPGLAQRDTCTTKFVEKTRKVSRAQETERGKQLAQGNCDWIKEPPTHIDNNAPEAASVDLPLALEKPRSQTKELDETTPLLSPLAALSIGNCDCDQIGRKILARAIYPQRPPNRPPPLPPRLKIARQIEPPTLVSLLSMLYILIISLFVDDDKPEIIEYSVGEANRGIRVRCEMLVVEGNGPCQAPVPGLASRSRRFKVRVQNKTDIIFMANLLVENEHRDTRRVVPIAAKPRRVRELLRDEGVGDVTEDVYLREIKGAMRMLCAMQGV